VDGAQKYQEWMNVLSSHGVEKKFKAGSSVFFQGDKLDRIGFVVAGQVDAWVLSEQGVKTWVDSFYETDFFGHVCLLTQSPIQYDVVALKAVTILFIPIRKIETLLKDRTGLSQEFAQDLAARLEGMTSRLIEAVTLSSPGRVCAELMRLSQPIGIDPDKLIIRPMPVFVELAFRINIARETVSRTVSDLQKDGVLSREPGSILIHNPKALRDLMR